MRGIRSYMGWSTIPDMDSATTGSDDNPFSGPKATVTGKVSVQMPTEDGLCKKIGKLNLTLVEGYPSRSSQSRWYGLFSDHKDDPAAVSNWNTESSKLNSCYSRIARQSGLTSTPPASRRISQESLRRWEKSAREATVICNQAASFNRCLFKVQQDMQSQLKSVRSDTKGKSSTKVSTAMDELQYLMDNASISQAAAKTMEHLSEFVFISMANLTLTHRDSSLTHVKTGIKADTVAALRQAPIHISTLFPDDLIKTAEEEISHHESKDMLVHHVARVVSTLMKDRNADLTRNQTRKLIGRHGKILERAVTENQEGKHNQPRASSHINDNQCLDKLQVRLLAGSTPPRQTMNNV